MASAKRLTLLILIFALSACETVMFDALEKVGYHKRDILIDRIESAQESQTDGQEQFTGMAGNAQAGHGPGRH